MTELGVGLVSVGWMGRLHSRSYRALAERYPELGARLRLVIAADPVASAAEEAVSRLGFEASTSDYREVIEHPDVDVVSICSPNFLHHEIALAAISAGKPFWIEKPMGRNARESREIAEGAAAAGLVTAVGFNYRHAPAIAHARELVRSGRLGAIHTVRCSLLADYSSDPDGARTWRFQRELAGSGVLGDLLSHGFDLAQFVVGDIAEVCALTETFIRERPEPSGAGASHFSKGSGGPMREVENEDYAAVLARFAGGAVGTFESSRIAIGPRAEYALEVYGSEGSLRWNFERLNELEVCLRSAEEYGFTRVMASPEHGEFGVFQPGGGIGMGFDDLKVIEAMLFVRSVLSGTQLAPSVADCWSTAEVSAAAQLSAQSRSWQPVTPVTAGRTTGR